MIVCTLFYCPGRRDELALVSHSNFPCNGSKFLKIRQYSLRNLLCYRKNCLCETASTCSAEFSQRISVRKGAGGLTPVKTDKAEGFVKIQPTGNASLALSCLSVHNIKYCARVDYGQGKKMLFCRSQRST